MLAFAAALLFGLVLLVWSADRFVSGAAGLSRRLGLSPLVIGMVVVGFGTSAPELTVSALASLGGQPALALGNAWGSNIVNIGLILGLTALLRPLAVQSRVLRQEVPILGVVTALTLLAAWDLTISRLEAGLGLVLFAALLTWSVRTGEDEPDAVADLAPAETGNPWLWTLLGLVLLIVAARLLVWGAVGLASAWGVSEIVIGLTIVAVGTSLPELAASLVAVRRGNADMALGNVIGSNLFNTLAVVGLAGIISPPSMAPEVLSRDLMVMALATAAVWLVCRPGKDGRMRIGRRGGGILLAGYLGYTAWLLTAV